MPDIYIPFSTATFSYSWHCVIFFKEKSEAEFVFICFQCKQLPSWSPPQSWVKEKGLCFQLHNLLQERRSPRTQRKQSHKYSNTSRTLRTHYLRGQCPFRHIPSQYQKPRITNWWNATQLRIFARHAVWTWRSPFFLSASRVCTFHILMATPSSYQQCTELHNTVPCKWQEKFEPRALYSQPDVKARWFLWTQITTHNTFSETTIFVLVDCFSLHQNWSSDFLFKHLHFLLSFSLYVCVYIYACVHSLAVSQSHSVLCVGWVQWRTDMSGSFPQGIVLKPPITTTVGYFHA